MSSAIQWQADLPGLSSLVLNMGAAGLKKIAQAGVDVHTLLCMGEIAEMCPASLEYRKQINKCRQKQRRQSVWIHKVVEIGTATNFIADELLKKRAGENIVALMSTILPILSEDDCDCLILRLFELSKVHADKTPGLGQLQSFRDAILSLAQQLDFKDRMCQYHVLLGRLRAQDQQPISTSIPGIELLAQATMMLHKIVLDDDARYVLAYRGWAGAAWLIAYARHVLNLAVCVLPTAQDSVPINGSYENSRVYVYIFEQETRCELLLDGKVNSLIAPNTSINQTVGVIDLENVNLRTTYIPDDPSLREASSVIIRSLTLYFTCQRTASLGKSQPYYSQEAPGASRYADYCFPHTSCRALRILDMMGFRVRTNTQLDECTWREYLLEGSQYWNNEAFYLRPGPKWMHSLQTHEDCSQTAQLFGFNEQQRHLLKYIFSLADAASCLAFSDWGENLRLISLIFLEYGLPENLAFHRLRKGEDTLEHRLPVAVETTFGEARFGEEVLLRFETCDRVRYQISHLAESIGYIVVGAGREQRSELTTTYGSLHGVIAFERQGVVFARAAAMEDTVNLDAKLIQIYPGHITLFDQRRMEIRSLNPSPSHGSVKISDPGKQHDDSTKKYYPFNGIGELNIKSMSRLSRSCIEVSRTLATDGSVMELNCPTLAKDEILDLYITGNCTHPYYSRAAVPLGSHCVVQDGFYHGPPPEAPRSIQAAHVFIQAVDQNPCGQWASVHNCYQHEGSWGQEARILQRNSCMQCVLKLIEAFVTGYGPMPYPSCYTIIPGQLTGEDMGEIGLEVCTAQSSMDTGND